MYEFLIMAKVKRYINLLLRNHKIKLKVPYKANNLLIFKNEFIFSVLFLKIKQKINIIQALFIFILPEIFAIYLFFFQLKF